MPVRSTQAEKGRYKVDAAVIRNRTCQRLNITTVFDDTEAVTQPLDCSASDEDAAFQAIDGLSSYTPADGSKETILRGNTFGTRVHEHKIARAEGVFRHTYFITCLSKSSSLLVTCIASHFNGPTEELRIGLSKHPTGRHHSREHGTRHPQFVEDNIVPITFIDVVHEGTRSIGGICRIHTSSRETPHQEGIDVSEQRIAAFCLFAHNWNIIKYPLDLGAGEIRISHQTCAFANFFVEAFRFQLIANRNSQTALPDNGIENGLSCVLVPDDSRFTLIGNTKSGNIRGGCSCLFHRLLGNRKLTRPDRFWIMLYQARRRINLGEFLLCYTHYRAIVIKDNRTRAGSALVQG